MKKYPFGSAAALALAMAFTLGNSPISRAADSDAATDDPYIWLEEVEGEAALEWVEKQNTRSLKILEGDARFEDLRQEAAAVLNATDRIPYGKYFGDYVHNFWQDENNTRGLWRRATLHSYHEEKPEWETVLDLDKLAEAEDENWVSKGRDCLAPDYDRCLVRLSRGGGDAVVVREFSISAGKFLDDGFTLQEAKQSISWIDQDNVLVGSDFGAGSMTTSGYSRTLRLWRRGTPIEDAKEVFAGLAEDVGSFPFVVSRPEATHVFAYRAPTFFTAELWSIDEDGKARHVPLQEDADPKTVMNGRMLVLLRSDWAVDGTVYSAGSLVSMDLAASLAADAPQDVQTIFAPGAKGSINGVSTTKETVYISALENVTGQLVAAYRTDDGWTTEPVDLPANGSLRVITSDDYSEILMVNFESHLTPDTLHMLARGSQGHVIKSLPARFDASGFVTEQRSATSADGTEIPYFILRPKDLANDGTTPTLLYGYGGFEISLTPSYVSTAPMSWLKSGGVYVVANIRGGGEFGPAWHKAALLKNRQRAYDDFIAVAEDLIATGVTSSRRLGIYGGSNGGLLVGAVFTQRPDLFSAVVCAVPLLDMLRYHKLLAGASWMAEYGDPDDPEMRAVIEKYSPYQNVSKDADYPEVFFLTSTKDDRVHPGHARKMVARMMGQGHDVLYFENTEGGHSAAANLKQAARRSALMVSYLLQKLKD